MTYKQQIKENELITKIRIIRSVKKDRIPVVQVAKAFSCHRNTINNIVRLFEHLVSDCDQQRLLKAGSLSQEELKTLYSSILNKSRKPNSNNKSASKSQEKSIVKLFKEEGIKVGVLGMKFHIQRRFEGDLSFEAGDLKKLTIGKLRGIYKRNFLVTQKVRSANGERRHLYDYRLLGCFERMHYDVKHILDKHALPQQIYDLLSGRDIPKYEWNIIDAKSRFRFMAYSYDLNSSFGFWFLLFVIQFLRRSLIAYDKSIITGIDNGVEFCSGSKRKEEDWNKIFNLMNASVYSYEPNFDIRKNLIERSHLTDDEALFISRGHLMGSKKLFHKEVADYSWYFNFLRHHTGIGMNNRTPFEVVSQSGLVGIERLKEFPILILDDVIDPLRKCLQPLLFEQFAKDNPGLIQKAQSCQKTRRNLEVKFPFLSDAQNVLTYYPWEVVSY